jgi:hypothetical protein
MVTMTVNYAIPIQRRVCSQSSGSLVGGARCRRFGSRPSAGNSLPANPVVGTAVVTRGGPDVRTAERSLKRVPGALNANGNDRLQYRLARTLCAANNATTLRALSETPSQLRVVAGPSVARTVLDRVSNRPLSFRPSVRFEIVAAEQPRARPGSGGRELHCPDPLRPRARSAYVAQRRVLWKRRLLIPHSSAAFSGRSWTRHYDLLDGN